MTRVIGRPTPRVEGLEKVTGAAKYAVDVILPGMLWGLLNYLDIGRIQGKNSEG